MLSPVSSPVERFVAERLRTYVDATCGESRDLSAALGAQEFARVRSGALFA